MNDKNGKSAWITEKMINCPAIVTLAVVGLMTYAVWVLFSLLLRIDFLFACLPDKWVPHINEGVFTGFSIIGTYFGVAATLVVGLITLRFSIKTDEANLALQIDQMEIDEIRLYDLWRDYRPSVLKYYDHTTNQITGHPAARYAIILTLEKFIPSYDVKIGKVEWSLVDEELQRVMPVELCDVKTYIEKRDNLTIYLYFNDHPDDKSTKKSMNYYYRLLCYEPITMRPYDRQRCLNLELQLTNKPFKKQNRKITLRVFVENAGYDDGYVNLQPKNYTIGMGNL